jgi:hypothetical protein
MSSSSRAAAGRTQLPALPPGCPVGTGSRHFDEAKKSWKRVFESCF